MDWNKSEYATQMIELIALFVPVYFLQRVDLQLQMFLDLNVRL